MSTEDAERFAREISLGDFPTLVRTYFVTQLAIAEIPDDNLQARHHLALRSQTLRESILEFLRVYRPGVPAPAANVPNEEFGGA